MPSSIKRRAHAMRWRAAVDAIRAGMRGSGGVSGHGGAKHWSKHCTATRCNAMRCKTSQLDSNSKVRSSLLWLYASVRNENELWVSLSSGLRLDGEVRSCRLSPAACQTCRHLLRAFFGDSTIALNRPSVPHGSLELHPHCALWL